MKLKFKTLPKSVKYNVPILTIFTTWAVRAHGSNLADDCSLHMCFSLRIALLPLRQGQPKR